MLLTELLSQPKVNNNNSSEQNCDIGRLVLMMSRVYSDILPTALRQAWPDKPVVIFKYYPNRTYSIMNTFSLSWYKIPVVRFNNILVMAG